MLPVRRQAIGDDEDVLGGGRLAGPVVRQVD
jgi:hypothetical protein